MLLQPASRCSASTRASMPRRAGQAVRACEPDPDAVLCVSGRVGSGLRRGSAGTCGIWLGTVGIELRGAWCAIPCLLHHDSLREWVADESVGCPLARTGIPFCSWRRGRCCTVSLVRDLKMMSSVALSKLCIPLQSPDGDELQLMRWEREAQLLSLAQSRLDIVRFVAVFHHARSVES